MDFNSLGKAFFAGALMNITPGMLEGVMQEYLGSVRVNDLVGMVLTDQNIWSMIDPKQQKTFTDLAPRLGDLDWLTLEWVMQTGRKSGPALYSVLENWPEGLQWLGRQIADIKLNLTGGS